MNGSCDSGFQLAPALPEGWPLACCTGEAVDAVAAGLDVSCVVLASVKPLIASKMIFEGTVSFSWFRVM